MSPGRRPAGSPKPFAHPKPSPTTIKQLYGTAFRCGEPSCPKPLYRVSETGEVILNSEIAHIHARSEGGPRWKPGMSSDDNKAAANLIPLCQDHASEIDDTPDKYPAELLRAWKEQQLKECRDLEMSWPLNDRQVAEVIEWSFDHREFGMATAGASSVLDAARAVGHLMATARQQRQHPRQAAQAWQQLRDEANRSWLPIYNAKVEQLRVEPPLASIISHRKALADALTDAATALQPLAATVVAELHAVQAADHNLTPWCDWVETATAAVLDACRQWPGVTHPTEDDNVLPDALAQLQRASNALSARWRGQDAEDPPPPTTPLADPVETKDQRQGRGHRELLETARPWARVTTRPYDAELYTRLVDAAQYALALPGVIAWLPFDLNATTSLAANVARSADDATCRALIDDATRRSPSRWP